MSDFKIVYLIVERGVEPNRQVFWRSAGIAFLCRDGSMNLRLDIHPGLTFNIREPKSLGEREEVYSALPEVNEIVTAQSNGRSRDGRSNGKARRNGGPSETPTSTVKDDDIPF